MLDLWYKSAIFYSLSVGSFMDANGDGVGDFHGLTDQLDHVVKLGATTSPISTTSRRSTERSATSSSSAAGRACAACGS